MYFHLLNFDLADTYSQTPWTCERGSWPKSGTGKEGEARRDEPVLNVIRKLHQGDTTLHTMSRRDYLELETCVRKIRAILRDPRLPTPSAAESHKRAVMDPQLTVPDEVKDAVLNDDPTGKGAAEEIMGILKSRAGIGIASRDANPSSSDSSSQHRAELEPEASASATYSFSRCPGVIIWCIR